MGPGFTSLHGENAIRSEGTLTMETVSAKHASLFEPPPARTHWAAVPVILLALILSTPLFGIAGEPSPGERIDADSTGYESLLPESVARWVQKGDLVLEVGTLDYDLGEYWPPVAEDSFESNAGKYDLDEEDHIVHAGTGEAAIFVVGIPFPDLDSDDPKAAQKILYNKNYYTHSTGNQRLPLKVMWMNRRGKEREVAFEYQTDPLDGHGGAADERNPKGIERHYIIAVKHPPDIAGTNILNWRYRDVRPDSLFGYLPAIRRVRRMSPANRSDAFLGSDICIDDAWGFDGKIQEFDWRLLARREVLVPFLDSSPQPLVVNGDGEWKSTKEIKEVDFVFQRPGRTGVSWAPTNLVWVKRPVYILEGTPKDPYYNYGTFTLWLDAEVNLPMYYKVIHDRAGEYWKTLWMSYSGMRSADGRCRLIANTSMQAVDDRADHCTINEVCSPNHIWTWFAKQDRNDYSLAGFQRLCK